MLLNAEVMCGEVPCGLMSVSCLLWGMNLAPTLMAVSSHHG